MTDDFIDKLLEEIHEENLKKKQEAEEILKRISEEKGFFERWLQ